MSKKIKIQITHWLNGSVLFEYESVDNTIKKTLEKAVSEGANLRSANLGYANLRSANLGYANLGYANLRYANLGYANLRSANLRSANLGSANLGYANLRSANLGYANLRYANLGYAKNLNKYWATDLSLLLLQRNRLTAYKYLTKEMMSPVQNMGKIKYEVGKEYEIKASANRLEDCAAGLNIATLEWCLKETAGNIKDYKFIEVSFDPKDLTVPYFSDGKFRVSKLKVERKLTQKELKPFTETIK